MYMLTHPQEQYQLASDNKYYLVFPMNLKIVYPFNKSQFYSLLIQRFTMSTKTLHKHNHSLESFNEPGKQVRCSTPDLCRGMSKSSLIRERHLQLKIN